MPVVIKKAGLEDVKLVAPLFDAYRIFYKQPSNEEAAADFLWQRLLNKESVIFIAFDDDIAVGFCQLFPIFSSVGLKRTWLLNDLYVSETARGKGVAAALLQQAKEFGVATDSRWLMLQTGANNLTAQSVYEKNGWKRVEDYFYELALE
ncbi:GNAT family N-acetyltransferase [Ferruginibacter sp. SUN106]|uniref:GNAT family N-acetyltransferase n=1 Tax=Ferruginibacter sp. SUN106 TaxID=2978348 RepID=UPI003D35BAC4